MKIKSLAFVALATALMGCSGNSLNNPLIYPESTEPETPTTDGTEIVTQTSPIVVPIALANNLSNATLIPGSGGNPDTLLVRISALATTPIDATWVRNTNLDIPGYRAFYVQEDALDRFFVALTAASADGSVNATVAGDGGQFNTFFSGAEYERPGAYTPPDASQAGPGNGQVSYKGKYAGLLNGGGGRNEALPIPPGRNMAPSEIPYQPAQVTGDVFVNANFADNKVNGVVKNRNTTLFGTPTGLEDVVLTPSDILANGTFEGKTQRPSDIDPRKTETGAYAGVFGGTDASSVAGAVHLDENVYDRNDTRIDGAIERGVFVLDQCGLTATAGGDCLGTAPTP